MSRFLREDLQELEAYVPGEQPRDRSYVKLNTNESPFPPCEAVRRAAAEEAGLLNLYPDPTGLALKRALAQTYGVTTEQVFLANGSDDILNFAFLAFCGKEKPAAFPDITYGFYQVFADLYGIPVHVIPLLEDLSIDLETFCAAPGMAVIANPNSPTGKTLKPAQIRKLLQSDPDRLVLVDEAYVDFGAESCVPLIKEFDNLLVVQTFSKSRSMAGARLGFALGSPELIGDLEKICYSTNPYAVNRMTLAAGLAALNAPEYDAANNRRIAKIREETAGQLKAMGFSVTESLANFLFIRPPMGSGRAFYEGLRKRGVLVRVYSTERIKGYVRVTVGDEEQMEKFLAAAEDYLKESWNA